MALCPRCGVELGENVLLCPLCGRKTSESLASTTQELASSGRKQSGEGRDGARDASPPPKRAENASARASVWEFSSVLALIVSVVLALVAWVTDGFGWLFYPLSSVLFLWVCATALLMFRKLKPLMFLVLAAAPLALLAAIDFSDASLDWFPGLGLPITLVAELALAFVVVAVRLTKHRGFNVVAYVFTGVALTLLAIEASIDYFVDGFIRLEWSNIACIALLPVAAFFVYIHYRVSNKATLKKFFHL